MHDRRCPDEGEGGSERERDLADDGLLPTDGGILR
jgi:hypothetical protein